MTATVPAPVSTVRLGFNTRVSFSDDVGPEQGLRDGIALFQAAEELGYQIRTIGCMPIASTRAEGGRDRRA